MPNAAGGVEQSRDDERGRCYACGTIVAQLHTVDITDGEGEGGASDGH